MLLWTTWFYWMSSVIRTVIINWSFQCPYSTSWFLFESRRDFTGRSPYILLAYSCLHFETVLDGHQRCGFDPYNTSNDIEHIHRHLVRMTWNWYLYYYTIWRWCVIYLNLAQWRRYIRYGPAGVRFRSFLFPLVHYLFFRIPALNTHASYTIYRELKWRLDRSIQDRWADSIRDIALPNWLKWFLLVFTFHRNAHWVVSFYSVDISISCVSHLVGFIWTPFKIWGFVYSRSPIMYLHRFNLYRLAQVWNRRTTVGIFVVGLWE